MRIILIKKSNIKLNPVMSKFILNPVSILIYTYNLVLLTCYGISYRLPSIKSVTPVISLHNINSPLNPYPVPRILFPGISG